MEDEQCMKRQVSFEEGELASYSFELLEPHVCSAACRFLQKHIEDPLDGNDQQDHL